MPNNNDDAQASESAFRVAWYRLLQLACWMAGALVFRIRVTGRENVPADGGVLLVSNHQSFFDPPLVGMGLTRRCHYLARSTLFGVPGFRWLIRSLNAVAIDRDAPASASIRTCVGVLKRGGVLLLFPEMTRTHDGEVQRMHGGFTMIARRAGVPIVPVAIHGAFDAWPRTRAYPWPAPVRVAFGEPIRPEDFGAGGGKVFVAEVRRKVCGLLAELREKPIG